MFRSSLKTTLFIVGFTALFSCAHLFPSHARSVSSQHGKGGVVAIGKAYDNGANARIEADRIMRHTCGGSNYTITREGEEIIETSHAEGTIKESGLRGPQRSNYTADKKVIEWRVTYVCKAK